MYERETAKSDEEYTGKVSPNLVITRRFLFNNNNGNEEIEKKTRKRERESVRRNLR